MKARARASRAHKGRAPRPPRDASICHRIGRLYVASGGARSRVAEFVAQDLAWPWKVGMYPKKKKKKKKKKPLPLKKNKENKKKNKKIKKKKKGKNIK
eukprot:NODE_13876_length_1141_cov_7.988166.p5 GENE.NODE_13876_length_1141_cov_7.988166~~NODE_13876_length_1141_cov_7.988166.p5  ORF type:complete len:98 (+),score=41.72 NODE_13876_length_1141_cov_7.988166:802-1095(+)